MHENKFHIVADENAVGLAALGRRFGTVELVPAEEITADLVKHADALIVRSVTKVDRSLIEGSAVRFVGSATAGVDHVDVDYLRQAGVVFRHAPASNAVSVVEYVLAALLVLCSRSRRRLDDLAVGIVGCGNVGSRLADRLSSLGVTVVRNDPPRARSEQGFVDLNTLLEQCNVITVHTPLDRLGAFPTHHLIDRRAFERMQNGTWLINAARGPIVETGALISAIDAGRVGHAVIDTWEGEPDVPMELLRRTTIATPHIAGYSYDSKLLGTRMVVEAMAAHFGIEFDAGALQASESYEVLPPDPALDPMEAARYVIDQAYDILADDARMRAMMGRDVMWRDVMEREVMGREHESASSRAAAFRELRRTYPRRYSFDRYRADATLLRPDVARVLADLGITLETGNDQVR